jgi:hypothetical protein
MSRILRRPLFRGGPVSSYGTGIASGLADGGRVGFYRGGGTKNKTTVLSQPKTLMPWDLGATQSGNKGAFGYLQGVSGPMWTGADIMNFIQDNPKWGGTNFSGILQGKWNSDTNRYEPPAVAHKYAMEQINDPELLKVMRNMMDPDLPLMDPNKTPEENTTVDTEEIWDDYDAGNEAKGIEVNKGEQTVDNNTGKVIDPEESTAISADDVREQAALFDKLLNEDYKKDLKSARISDEKNNDLPTGSVAVTSILTEKKEGSQLPIVADIKSLVVEENKNQIFIDESSKKVYQVVEDANGNLTLKTLAQ